MIFSKKIASLLFLQIVGSSGLANAASTPASIVDLGYAKYQGTPIHDEINNASRTQFLGIRYASPPTGSARFRAPGFPASTPGVQLANTEPPMCLQGALSASPTSPFRVGEPSLGKPVTQATDNVTDPDSSEDCLFLNVYVPENIGQKKLPVVFWIHGGGYVLGSASGFLATSFNGNDLIRESGEGVVVVVIQYRLGLFGFLPGQKVKDGGALNAGLLDQQFALKWVQKHISKFGGDPQQVTIWGESAGAASVMQHLIANGGKTNPPLFRAGMTSSTYLPSHYKFNGRIPELLYSETVTQANCSSAADTLECLREADVNLLETANVEINASGFFGTFVFVPVVDGTFITDRPTVLLKKGKLNAHALLSVVNTFEGTVFVNQSATDVQISDYLPQLFPNLGAEEIQAATAQYAGLGSNVSQAIAILGESILICPTYTLMKALDGHAYKATFAIPPGGHGDDVPYFFPNGTTPAFANPAFAKAFSESFLNFAMSYNVNTKWDPTDITPQWQLWNGSNEMLFNKTEAGALDIRPVKSNQGLLERCNFWESISASTSQ
ncbi:hypothetical protein GALMADRAFT_137768 [Galerina marginata CBS 339.88]|uniref:Carboxylic ester hydrolase n=1 Tax=Galerina marginata (strain CBS 339.88) TaxID=685588 RepID=A0A067TIE7_GALM3|nr:hypothetical protein GALMADRAFT_137768 [Galerina marginata CBS 339.88]